MRNFLLKTAEFITRKKRYFPEIVWSDNSYIYNAFRALEWLFGARYGVRPTAMVERFHRDGKVIMKQYFFTLESILCHIEGNVRSSFKGIRVEHKYVMLPRLQLVGVNNGDSIMKIPSLVFAIAYDTNGAGNSGSPAVSYTYNHTVTGSNPGIVVFVFVGDGLIAGSHLSDITYAGVSLGAVVDFSITGNRYLYLRKKTACATGSNNVAVSFNNIPYSDSTSLSYTGVDQTDMEDGHNSGTATGNLTLSVTTSTDNCWISSGATNLSLGLPSAGTGTTQRDTQGNLAVGDSNGPKTPTGAQTMQWTAASGATYGAIIAIKPSTGTSTSVKTAGGLAIASVKTGGGLATVSVKTWGGLA